MMRENKTDELFRFLWNSLWVDLHRQIAIGCIFNIKLLLYMSYEYQKKAITKNNSLEIMLFSDSF